MASNCSLSRACSRYQRKKSRFRICGFRRVRSPAFQKGWHVAEQLAVGRLSPIAFDRSINGRVEQIYRDGELVAERRVPSDKLLTWLLARLDPKRFALPWEQRGDADPQAEAAAAFPALLEAITDVVS